MKHHDARRPVGKCKGCCLNSRTACAAGLEPRSQMSHGYCTHYNDLMLLAQAMAAPQPQGARLAKDRRRQAAHHARSEPHYNGAMHPAKHHSHAAVNAR